MKSFLNDWLKDWRRWTRAERVTALVVMFLLIGLPAALAINVP